MAFLVGRQISYFLFYPAVDKGRRSSITDIRKSRSPFGEPWFRFGYRLQGCQRLYLATLDKKNLCSQSGRFFMAVFPLHIIIAIIIILQTRIVVSTDWPDFFFFFTGRNFIDFLNIDYLFCHIHPSSILRLIGVTCD